MFDPLTRPAACMSNAFRCETTAHTESYFMKRVQRYAGARVRIAFAEVIDESEITLTISTQTRRRSFGLETYVCLFCARAGNAYTPDPTDRLVLPEYDTTSRSLVTTFNERVIRSVNGFTHEAKKCRFH